MNNLVVPMGVEPTKPASLVQYLCQFGYETILVPAEGNAPTRRVNLTDLQSVPPL